MNPFDLTGPSFLVFHATLWCAALALALWVRWRYLRPNDLPIEEPPLHPYEVAHLTGGATLAVNAAILRLVDAKHLLHDAVTDKLTRNPDMAGQPLGRPHPVDNALLALPDEFSVKEARDACAAEMATMRTRLVELGLEARPEASAKARTVPAVIMFWLLFLSGIKLLVGASRGKPIVFLIITSVVTVIVMFLLAFRRAMRTGRGERLLEVLKARHDALRVAAGKPASTLSNHDLPLAVGLFGTAALAGIGYAHMQRALQPPTNAVGGCGGGAYYSDTGGGCGGGCGGGGGSWGTSSGGSGGDGGGGGGDGGGGGCGGCGGGGGD